MWVLAIWEQDLENFRKEVKHQFIFGCAPLSQGEMQQVCDLCPSAFHPSKYRSI